MAKYEIDWALLQIMGPYFIALCALIVGFKDKIIEALTKPKLVICFTQDKEEFFHKILFAPIEKIRDPIKNMTYVIRQPGINSRVSVWNKGSRAARKVQVRLEKIVFHDKNGKFYKEIFYHPSLVKWSGEKEYGTVDITRDSYFFLDLFYIINESRDEIIRYYEAVDKETINRLVGRNEDYSGDVFWNVWVDTSYERGIPYRYDYEGTAKAIYVLSAENCEPFKFVADMQWGKVKWSEPLISVKMIEK